MKILFLSRWFPYPCDNGSKLRIYGLLRGLAQYHDVTLLSFVDPTDLNQNMVEIQSLCSKVEVVPRLEFNPQSWRSLLGFFSLKPRSLADTFSAEMAQKIKQLLCNSDFDLVIASQLPMAAYRPYFGKAPAMFEEVEIGLSTREESLLSNFKKNSREAFTWFKLRLYLSRLLDSYQACTVVSEQERLLFVQNFQNFKGKFKVIPNGVEIGEYQSQKSTLISNQLIFSGSFRYHANYEAMLWFVHEVYPHILEQIPNAQLVITGDHANLKLPTAPNVRLTGYVNDIKTMIATSWVSVAPLMSGGGTRLKILEAMSLGTPVVSTSKGAEGLNARSGEHLYIVDEPKAFAESVVKILKDRDLREKIAANAYRFVKEQYAWEVITPRFLKLVESMVGNN